MHEKIALFRKKYSVFLCETVKDFSDEEFENSGIIWLARHNNPGKGLNELSKDIIEELNAENILPGEILESIEGNDSTTFENLCGVKE